MGSLENCYHDWLNTILPKKLLIYKILNKTICMSKDTFKSIFILCLYEQCIQFNQQLMGKTAAQIWHQMTCNLSLILLVTFQEHNNLTFPKFQVTKKFKKIRKPKSV